MAAGATALAAAAAVVLPSAVPDLSAPAAAAVPASFVLTGDGFGHGVGMAQYGARAQADAGRTVAQILPSYYSGTALSTVADAADVRIQVLGGLTRVTAKTAAVATGGGAFKVTIGGRTLTGSATSAITAVPSSAGVTVTVTTGTTTTSAAGAVADLRWAGTRFLAGTATLLDVPGAGGRYRHGRMEIVPISGRLSVVNVLRLHDEYLYGIAEMPSSWPVEALKAQAVAARTYAIASYNGGVRTACRCHLYDEVTSQKFTGWTKENEGTGGVWGARWRAAVTGTAPSSTTGWVLTSGGKLITAYYHSSSGGRTENSEDVWTAALPYARSVDDPWSLRGGNPYVGWTRTVTQAAMAAAVGLPDVATLDLSVRTAGGSVDVVTARSSAGAAVTLAGRTFSSRLGLPSAWLRKPVSRLGGADRYATAAAVADAVPASTKAVLVSGLDAHLIDGVAAAPLAASLGAPVLLVAGTGLSESVSRELTRRGVRSVVVVGAAVAVPEAVLASLRARGISAERVAGRDRYETAAAVALRMGSASRKAVVAAGDTPGISDALAAAAVAAAARRPVLLTAAAAVPASTAQALAQLGITGTTCVGGPSVLSEAVRVALPVCARVMGADRYATSAALVSAFAPIVTTNNLTVANGGDAYAIDGLVGAALGRPMVYVSAGVPGSVSSLLRTRVFVQALTVVGGPAAVPEQVVVQLRRL